MVNDMSISKKQFAIWKVLSILENSSPPPHIIPTAMAEFLQHPQKNNSS